MSQKEHSRAHRRRTYKRVRGIILILLVLGLIAWGVTALVRRNAAQPDPTPDPNAGQQTGTTDEKQNNPILILTPNRLPIRLRNQPLTPLRIPSPLPIRSLPAPT